MSDLNIEVFRHISQGDALVWLLRDEFSGSLAAGSVNGTLSDSGHVRTVTDGNSKLSVGSGVASFATGGVGAGNPGLWYPSMVRTAGRVLVANITVVASSLEVGWDSNQAGTLLDGILFGAAGALNVRDNGNAIALGAVYATATPYWIAVLPRAAGFYALIKGGAFSNWTLFWASVAASTTPLFPGVIATNTTGVATPTFIRIPANLWLPIPIVSDGFSGAASDGLGHAEQSGLGSGGSGAVWSGASWVVAAGAVTNAPTLGAELLSNPGFEGAYDTEAVGIDIAPGWDNRLMDTGVDTAASEATIIHGGSAAQKFTVDASLEGVVSAAFAVTLDTWYQVSVWARADSSTPGLVPQSFVGNLPTLGVAVGMTTAYQQLVSVVRATGTGNDNFRLTSNNAGANTFYVDDASVKAIVLADMFRTVSAGVADVMLDVNVTRLPNTVAGLVLNLDSAVTPANFVIAYLDAKTATAKLDKVVAGVYTSVVSAAITYSAGATLRVAKIGTGYRLYYAGLLVGSGVISDSGIVNNGIHGLFSGNSANSFDNFVVRPSGDATNPYAYLDQFILA